jgi:uncharacterized membrane protein
MLVELLALLASLIFAFSSIFLKRGLKFTDVTSAAFFSTIIQTITTWIAVLLFVPLNLLFNEADFLFVLSGIFVSFVGVQLTFVAVDRAGVSIAYPIIATQPFYSAMIAAILLKEQITIFIGVGTILIVAGISLLSYNKEGRKEWEKIGIVAALLTALVYAFSAIPRKVGLNMVNSPNFPILGTAVEMSTGFLCYSLYFAFLRKGPSLNRKSLGFFSFYGLAITVSTLLILFALNLGKVIIVSPLFNTYPLFTLFLAHLFLGKIERITPKVIICTLLIVSGSTLIVIS